MSRPRLRPRSRLRPRPRLRLRLRPRMKPTRLKIDSIIYSKRLKIETQDVPNFLRIKNNFFKNIWRF